MKEPEDCGEVAVEIAFIPHEVKAMRRKKKKERLKSNDAQMNANGVATDTMHPVFTLGFVVRSFQVI